jgi:hypothetical protein
LKKKPQKKRAKVQGNKNRKHQLTKEGTKPEKTQVNLLNLV